MELLDVVDENNNLTGKREERKVVHEKCLWHRHVSCYIMNQEGKLLFQKRSSNKLRNPNKWSKTGGHVDAGETVEDAILREIKEEVGVDIKKENIELIEVFKNDYATNKSFGYDFFTVVDYKENEYVIQKEELSEVKYFTIEEIEEIKRRNDPNYTFSRWEDDVFYRKIKLLKEKREDLLLKNNVIKK